MRKERTNEIRAFLAQAVYAKQKDLVDLGVNHFGISRQAIHRYLAGMVKDGILVAEGKTQGRSYSLQTLDIHSVQLPLAEHPAEHEVWQNHFASLVSKLPRNVIDICCHGFTEIFNNAVDHSEGNEVKTFLRLTYATVEIYIHDNGVGIFSKIRSVLNLASEREAILELTKGKVTTDPIRHSGEGIFFTSRMFDSFSILSGRLSFQHNAPDDDWVIDSGPLLHEGTLVAMKIGVQSKVTPKEIFDHYTSSKDMPAFDKTCLPVGLLCIENQSVVSRSQAKRLLAGIDQFKKVMLDFKGVEMIGQAFADEIFRVFKQQHPEIEIKHVNANNAVEMMILRVRNTAQMH